MIRIMSPNGIAIIYNYFSSPEKYHKKQQNSDFFRLCSLLETGKGIGPIFLCSNRLYFFAVMLKVRKTLYVNIIRLIPVDRIAPVALKIQ